MINIDDDAFYDLEKFLNQIVELYIEEDPAAKKGIGDGIEHIKGVLHRTNEIVDILLKVGFSDEIRIRAITIAALHDIGNLIDRDFHNHCSFGVVMGSLDLQDIIEVPCAGYISADLSAYASHYPEAKTFEQLYKIAKEKYDYAVIDLIDKERENTIKVDTAIETFNRSYKNSQKLQSITSELRKIFSRGEIMSIARAVQVHNVGFDDRKTPMRYHPGDVHGMIIADADIDIVPMTFNLRTYAFAVNSCVEKEKIRIEKEKQAGIFQESTRHFTNPDGSPNHEMCLKYIQEQAFERFREEPLDAPETLIEGILLYKDLQDIPGVEETQDKPPKDNVHYPVCTLSNGKRCRIHPKYTDNIPMLYEHYDIEEVLELRRPFTKTLNRYLNSQSSEYLKKSLELTKELYDKCETLEEAVDIGEILYYADRGIDLGDNSYQSIIRSSIKKCMEDRDNY